MSSDFFQFVGYEESKEAIENILYEDDYPEVFILTDTFLSKDKIKLIKEIVTKFSKIRNICIIYVFDEIKEIKKAEKNLKKYAIDHTIDLTKFIPPGSKIITLGRALYSTTFDTDIQLNSFYDIVWNDEYTKFYDPITKSWIFPVSWLMGIYNFVENKLHNNWEWFHFKRQLKKVYNFNPPKLRIPELKYEVIENTEEFFKKFENEKQIAYDLETSGFNCMRNDIRCLTISFDGRKGYYLRWKDIIPESFNRFLKDKYQIGANLKFDCRFLRRFGITNSSPDFDTMQAGHCLNEMRSNSLKTHAWFYTYYGGYNFGLEKYKIKYPRTKNYSLIPEKVMIPYATMDAIITFQVYQKMVKHLAEDPLLEKYFYEEVMPTVKMFVEIETQGVYINWDNIREQKKVLLQERQEIINDIHKLINNEVTSNKLVSLLKSSEGSNLPFLDSKSEEEIEIGNLENTLNSSKKLAEILEYDLKLPFLGTRNKSDLYFTNEEHLKEWKKDGFKIADLLLQYRSYNALLNTFIGDEKVGSAYWEYKAPDGKIHPSYSVMMAGSHRNKCNSPNLQQVPHHGEKAWRIRSFFDVPSSDYYISEFDYAGFQLRIAAIISGDKNMEYAFKELGGHIHSFTAHPIFCPEITLEEFISKKKESPYDEYRFAGKRIGFGFLFGMIHFTFANNTIRKEWSYHQCKDFCKEHNVELLKSLFDDDNGNKKVDYPLSVANHFRNMFFDTYPGLAAWHKSTHEFAKNNGYVRYVHGGRRLLPQLLYTGNDIKLESSLKNISLNSPVQNFEIVIISRAMGNLNKFFIDNNLKSRIWVTVHDAIGFYIHKDEVDLLKIKIPEIMEQVYIEYKNIPLEVEGDLANPHNKENPTYWGYGKNWV